MNIHTACVPIPTVIPRSKLTAHETGRIEKMGYTVEWESFDQWHQVLIGSDFVETDVLERRAEKAIRKVTES